MGITHAKVSAISDGGDTSLVRPSDWNADHVSTGFYKDHYAVRYVGGNITISTTSQGAVTGPSDLVIDAASGDLLKVGVSIRPVTTTAQSLSFEFATIVSGSPNRYIGAQSTTAVNIPVAAWYIASADLKGIGGDFPYIVDSSDVVSGQVTLRLYGRVSSSTRQIVADSSNPLDIWVTNLGQ